eukprot:scaffold770_cov255-Pinguiococcus_pyrenoidosus.AAC.61
MQQRSFEAEHYYALDVRGALNRVQSPPQINQHSESDAATRPSTRLQAQSSNNQILCQSLTPPGQKQGPSRSSTARTHHAPLPVGEDIREEEGGGERAHDVSASIWGHDRSDCPRGHTLIRSTHASYAAYGPRHIPCASSRSWGMTS